LFCVEFNQTYHYKGATSTQRALTRKYNILFVPDPTRALLTAPSESVLHEWMEVVISGGWNLVVNPNLQGYIFLHPNSNDDKEGESSVYIYEKVRRKINIIPTTIPTITLLAIRCPSVAPGI
jgi:hypothetical protein